MSDNPPPLYEIGNVLRADPAAAGRVRWLVGTVIERNWGWKQRDDSIYPCWWYRLDFPDAPGSPIVCFPEVYLKPEAPILLRIKAGWLERWRAFVGSAYVPVIGFEDGAIVQFLGDLGDGYYRVRSVEFPYAIGESLWSECLEKIDNPSPSK